MPLEFSIVITSRRTLHLAPMCLDSIHAQLGNPSIRTLYVDDASDYTESEKADLRRMLKKVNGEALFLSQRHYQIGALSVAVPLITSRSSIVCLVDGDDYLLSQALQRVTEAYRNPDIAMTYGNVLVDFRPYQDTQQNYFFDKKTVNTLYPSEVWRKRSFRQDGFRCFHLKTFRRWLWDFIDPQDFLRSSKEFFHASGDSAYTFPMLELLGDPKHVEFIEEPLYVYRLHAGNVHNEDKKSQSDDLEYLRFSKEKYPLIERHRLKQLLQESSACVA